MVDVMFWCRKLACGGSALGEIERHDQPRGWSLWVLYSRFVDLRRRDQRSHVAVIEDDEEFVSADPCSAEEAERAWSPARSRTRGGALVKSSDRCGAA